MKFLITCTSGLENITKNEILNIYPSARVRYTYFKGVIVAEISDSVTSVINKLSKIPTIAKVFPIHFECKTDVNEIIESLKKLKDKWPKENETYKIEVKRRGQHTFTSRDLIKILANLFNSKVNLENPDVLIRIDILQNITYISIVRKGEYLKKEPEIKKKWIDRERPLNRAQLKIEEIYKKFPHIFNTISTVIDLGAAPGGWSKFLSNFAKIIYAVDPAELEIKNEKIIHIKKKIQDVKFENIKAELITCDINDEPEKILPEVIRIAKETNARFIIFTIKLPDLNPKTIYNKIKYVENVLKNNGFKILFLGKLKANTRLERTVVAEKHGS